MRAGLATERVPGRVADGRVGIYALALGPDWAQLDPAVVQIHGVGRRAEASGDFTIRRGRGPGARLLAAMLRLPAAGVAVPVHLRIDRGRHGEVWRRSFGVGPVLRTTQRVLGPGRIEEQVGIVCLVLDVAAHDGALQLRQVGAHLRLGALQVRIPTRLSPMTTARAAPAGGGRVAVSAQVVLPRGDVLVTYAGVVQKVKAR